MSSTHVCGPCHGYTYLFDLRHKHPHTTVGLSSLNAAFAYHGIHRMCHRRTYKYQTSESRQSTGLPNPFRGMESVCAAENTRMTLTVSLRPVDIVQRAVADSSDMAFFRKTVIFQRPLPVITFPSLRAVFAGRSVAGERPFLFSVSGPLGGQMPVDSSMKNHKMENMRRHCAWESKKLSYPL